MKLPCYHDTFSAFQMTLSNLRIKKSSISLCLMWAYCYVLFEILQIPKNVSIYSFKTNVWCIFYARGDRPSIKIESELLECACIQNVVYPILNGFLCDFVAIFFICKDRVIWLRALSIQSMHAHAVTFYIV